MQGVRWFWHPPSTWQRVAVAAIVLQGSCVCTALAQDPVPSPAVYARSSDYVSVPASELDQLHQRLQETERRLRTIEFERLPPIEAASFQQDESSDESSDKSDGDSLEERIKALEEENKKAEEAAEKKKAEEEEKKAAAAKKPTMRWQGRVQADYWAFPETSPGANAFETGDPLDSVDDRFLFRRLRITVQGDVADNMVYRLDVDFNNPNSPQIKDAFIGWTELPVLQTVQLGNQKRPYGLDAINSTNFNVFLERPAVIDAFNPEYRRFGLQSWGVSDDLAYNWRYGVFLQPDVQNVGAAFATPDDEDYQAEVAGRFANTIWYDERSDGRGFAHWAIAGAVASPDGDAGSDSSARFLSRPEARTSSRWVDTGVIDGAKTYELLGLEGLLNVGPLQVVGEYQHVWMQRDAAFDNVDFGGAYVYASYFLTGETMAWDRETGQLARFTPFQNFFLVPTCDGGVGGGWGAWQVGVRYSYLDLNDEDIAGGMLNGWTYALNWYWNAHSRMQFNYINGNIHDRAPVAGQTAASYQIIGARFSVDF